MSVGYLGYQDERFQPLYLSLEEGGEPFIGMNLNVMTINPRTKRMDQALLYVSDHGESLGEYGLFLHGMPYSLAPDAQKHVPMVAWLDESLARRRGLSAACLRADQGRALTHDNLYHTVLGALDVRSPTYQRALDAFGGCRKM